MKGAPDGLQTIDERERVLLAPYAMKSRDSRGRKHAEPTHAYRGPFQRDRDRILHSSAYRRLSGKLQVFTGDMGDYHRTRLTHTHEVASIARTIGRALRLNEDLIEALALFHDIGHPPFGHAGEDALHECLRDEGGFSHNQFALTLAEELEERNPAFRGLNLTWEVLDSQATRAAKEDPATHPVLEAQVVDLADSMTYDAHDTDDAVKLGLVELEELLEVPLVGQISERLGLQPKQGQMKFKRKAIVHALIDWQVNDLLARCGPELGAADFRCVGDVKQAEYRMTHSTEMRAQKAELETFLFNRVYRHPTILESRQHAQHRLKRLFDAYRQQPERLPRRYRQRIPSVGLKRGVADYLAGMTDRFCDQRYGDYVEQDSAPRGLGVSEW